MIDHSYRSYVHQPSYRNRWRHLVIGHWTFQPPDILINGYISVYQYITTLNLWGLYPNWRFFAQSWTFAPLLLWGHVRELHQLFKHRGWDHGGHDWDRHPSGLRQGLAEVEYCKPEIHRPQKGRLWSHCWWVPWAIFWAIFWCHEFYWI